MKKLQLFIILLVVIVLFAYADYRLNVPEGIDLPNIPSISKDEPKNDAPVVTLPNVTQIVLDTSGMAANYKIEKRTRTTELFETFNLSNVANVTAFSNVIIPKEGEVIPLYVYEIHGPKGQGKITYLNVKLKLIDQLGSSANINETGDHGFNSLFYNDVSNPNSGFLLSQIGDMVFGFKYSKTTENSFDSVKQFVEYYMSKITN